MDLLFCADAGVRQGVAMAALSVADHTEGPLTFHLMTARLPDREPLDAGFAARLEALLRETRPEARVRLYDMTGPFTADPPVANMATRFTPLCMLRLYADRIPELPDRLLYLDADVLCRKDFSDLYHADMKGAEIAGVPDRYGKWLYGRIWRHEYLNSGVLLLDMAAIRESGLFARCRALCRDREMFLPDQHALNRLAKKRKLPRRYNEQGPLREETVFKHFSTFFRFFPRFRAVTVKPWQPEAMHEVLGLYEFDDLLTRSQRSVMDEPRDPSLLRR